MADPDFGATPTVDLVKALRPLREASPELDEYIRRHESQSIHERDILRLLLQVVALPRLAVVDFEATFYDTADEQVAYGKEIIEMGWCLLEPATGEVLDRKQFFIKPTKGYVSARCTELTGITPERVAGAESFLSTMGEVFQLHQRLGIKVWAAFGHYDRDMLQAQCKVEDVPNPWEGQRFFNIRELAGAYLGYGKNQPGLVKALNRAGLEFEGAEHSGLDDAVNTARLLAHLMGRGAS